MTVPLLDLKSQYRTIKTDILKVVEEIFESQHFILGQWVETLEKQIAEYTGATHAVGVSSGTDALLTSMMALEIGFKFHRRKQSELDSAFSPQTAGAPEICVNVESSSGRSCSSIGSS